MIIYLIRHGETVANAAGRRQGDDIDGLSAVGRKQATALADRLADYEIDHLISSPLIRADQTAQILSQAINQPVNHLALVKERVNPTSIVGQSITDPISQNFIRELFARAKEADWRYEDGENLADVKDRAVAFLDHLADLPYERVAVVSHAGFLRILTGCMIFGPDLPLEMIPSLSFGLAVTNAGLSTVEKVDHPAGAWRVITWNDRSHLD